MKITTAKKGSNVYEKRKWAKYRL